MDDTNRQKKIIPWWERPLTVCPICGKEFSPAPLHSWKIGNVDRIGGASPELDENFVPDSDRYTRLVCSYHCMRVWEKEREAELKAKIKKDGVLR